MPLQHAILAFLDLSPKSGYDLKKHFDASVGHFWSATQSHIYKALDTLEQAQWVTADFIAQEGKPNRKEYHITADGRAELRRWLAAPLPLQPVREAWLIQIFFAHHLSNEEIIALLEARRAEMVGRLAGYQAEAQNSLWHSQDVPERLCQLWDVTLDYGLSHYQSEIAWLERVIGRLRDLPPLP